MMELEQWFEEYDEIDEHYAAIMRQWPDSLGELNEERKILKRHLKKYPASKKNCSLNTKEIIAAVEAKMPRIYRGDLRNILAGYWTAEPGDGSTAAILKAPVLQQRIPVISAVIKHLGYPPLKIPYGGKAKIRKICMEEHPDLFTENTFLSAWKEGKKTGKKRWEVDNLKKFQNN